MALYTPKKVVLNWYRYEASSSIELMACFVSTLEKQAVESIGHYTNTLSITGHEGLDKDTWDLDSIFGECDAKQACDSYKCVCARPSTSRTCPMACISREDDVP
jgi:hypothetical protein